MIRLYDFDYKLLAETDRCISSEWELKFNGVGTYEGVFELNTDFAAVLSENRYLIVTEDDRQAVCTGKYISDNLHVYGRTPEWLLSKRVVLPFKTSAIFGEEYTDPETVLLYLLDKAYKTPDFVDKDGTVIQNANTDAICDDLIIPRANGCESFGRHFWRNNANTLADVIKDLCDYIGCGHILRADFDKKCWVFDLVYGKERTVLLSKNLKNCYDLTLKESLQEQASGGYFEIYDSEAEQKPYGYINKGNSGKGMLYWDCVIASAAGQSEAEAMLMKKETDYKLDCELMGVMYGKDYELGDTVRIQFESGNFRKTLKRRITGVSIISSASQRSIKPTLSEI